MKQPRADAFDPHAAQESPESAVVDYPLKSPLNDFPAITRPPQPTTPPILPDRENLPGRPGRGDRIGASPSVSSVVSANTANGVRKMKPRHAFDIYQDQFEALRQLALEDRMRGGPGSMSAMVREALDDFIACKREQ